VYSVQPHLAPDLDGAVGEGARQALPELRARERHGFSGAVVRRPPRALLPRPRRRVGGNTFHFTVIFAR
jgi:hypothetical protein